MRRRTFVWLSMAGLLAGGLPIAGYFRNKQVKNQLAHPLLLSGIFDEATLRQIGETYRGQNPGEQAEEVLEQKITEQFADTPFEGVHLGQIESLINSAIKADFAENRTVLVNGWVLSQTEARQCALFSMTQQN